MDDVRLCLIGRSVSGSPSRAMHEAALAAVGLTGSYELISVDPEGLPGVVTDLRRGRWHGANVTIPYKLAIASVCDELGADATSTGAVNTVSHVNGRLVGDNTDAAGFELGLGAHNRWPVPGTNAVVIGAGGAAAAVVLALSRVPVARTTIVARRVDAARALVARLGAAGIGNLAVSLWDEDYLASTLAKAGLVVNATPAGLPAMPFSPAALPASCTVADVRYRPRPIDVVAAAEAAGRPACDGFEMVLHQAMLSFRRWTGEEPPHAVARAALLAALKA